MRVIDKEKAIEQLEGVKLEVQNGDPHKSLEVYNSVFSTLCQYECGWDASQTRGTLCERSA